MLQETDGNDFTTKEYTSTAEQYGELVSSYENGQDLYFETDALGSTDALLTNNEFAQDRYTYRAFGLATHTGTPACGSFLLHGPLPAPLGSVGSSTSSGSEYNYVGRQGYFQDVETGLYWLRKRPYDPGTSQFTSEDPIGYADDINLYRYCRNNPVNLTDPSGLAGDLTTSAIREALKKKDPEVASYLADVKFEGRSYSPFQDKFYMQNNSRIGIGGGRTFWTEFVFETNATVEEAVNWLINEVRKGPWRRDFEQSVGLRKAPPAELRAASGIRDADNAAAQAEAARRDLMRKAGYSEITIWAEATFLPGGYFDTAIEWISPWGLRAQVKNDARAARYDRITGRQVEIRAEKQAERVQDAHARLSEPPVQPVAPPAKMVPLVELPPISKADIQAEAARRGIIVTPRVVTTKGGVAPTTTPRVISTRSSSGPAVAEETCGCLGNVPLLGKPGPSSPSDFWVPKPGPSYGEPGMGSVPVLGRSGPSNPGPEAGAKTRNGLTGPKYTLDFAQLGGEGYFQLTPEEIAILTPLLRTRFRVLLTVEPTALQSVHRAGSTWSQIILTERSYWVDLLHELAHRQTFVLSKLTPSQWWDTPSTWREALAYQYLREHYWHLLNRGERAQLIAYFRWQHHVEIPDSTAAIEAPYPKGTPGGTGPIQIRIRPDGQIEVQYE